MLALQYEGTSNWNRVLFAQEYKWDYTSDSKSGYVVWQSITEVAKVYEGASSSGPRTPRMYVWEIPTRRLQQQARQSECLVLSYGEVG